MPAPAPTVQTTTAGLGLIKCWPSLFSFSAGAMVSILQAAFGSLSLTYPLPQLPLNWLWAKNRHNGTLANGNMDQNLRSPVGLILTHTQLWAKFAEAIRRRPGMWRPMRVRQPELPSRRRLQAGGSLQMSRERFTHLCSCLLQEEVDFPRGCRPFSFCPLDNAHVRTGPWMCRCHAQFVCFLRLGVPFQLVLEAKKEAGQILGLFLDNLQVT